MVSWRTVFRKQLGLGSNFSENNFSQTSRTNCVDEPRTPSLRVPSPSSLCACTCTSQKGLDSEEVTQSSFDLEELHFRTSSI